MNYLQKSCLYTGVIFCFACTNQKPQKYQRYTFIIINLEIQSDIVKSNGEKENPEELKAVLFVQKYTYQAIIAVMHRKTNWNAFDVTETPKCEG